MALHGSVRIGAKAVFAHALTLALTCAACAHAAAPVSGKPSSAAAAPTTAAHAPAQYAPGPCPATPQPVPELQGAHCAVLVVSEDPPYNINPPPP